MDGLSSKQKSSQVKEIEKYNTFLNFTTQIYNNQLKIDYRKKYKCITVKSKATIFVYTNTINWAKKNLILFEHKKSHSYTIT